MTRKHAVWIRRNAVWLRLCGVLVFAVALTCGEAAGASTQGTVPVLSGCEPDYPPYCIVTPEKRADGFSVELLRAALKAVGREVVFLRVAQLAHGQFRDTTVVEDFHLVAELRLAVHRRLSGRKDRPAPQLGPP